MRFDIRVLELDPFFSYEQAREPLKFGAVVVEGVTYCHVRAKVENQAGDIAEGWGAIFLMDFWGFPSPLVPHPQRDEAMRLVTQRFCEGVADYPGYAHPIDIFLDMEDDLRRINEEVCGELELAEEMPFLGALVSAAPVDAALHDAFGQVNSISTYDGYGPEFMGHDLAYYLDDDRYRGRYIGNAVRSAYLPVMPIFHLVGGLDTLWKQDVKPDAPQDGLPNSLQEWIEREGLICLKVKLRGTDLAWDLNRTLEVVRVAEEVQARQGRRVLFLSADTNEQCESPEYVIELLNQLKEANPYAFESLLYMEQPTERELRAHRFDMRELAKIKPVIVDESLTGLQEFELAMELGWSGIALKTCKGQSTSLIYAAKAGAEGIPYTIQDLTNPGLALLHSVGLAARLNTMMGVEANSRQYFPATSKLERQVHPDIFAVRDGVVWTHSLQGNGLGYRISEIRRDIFE